MTQESDGQLHAAIDLGTNSFHLLIARVGDDGQFDVVASEKEMVRLGSGAGDMAKLTPEAIDRGIACLGRFGQLAEVFGADISAVATSAVREAKNKKAFLKRARKEAGIDIEVVSGVEEARLIHLGIVQALPVYNQSMFALDIGGGSTEFVGAKGTSIDVIRSEKIGAIRLTDGFFPEGRVKRAKVKECRTYIRSFLHSAFSEFADFTPDVAVGSSGTINTLARMIFARSGASKPQNLNGAMFTRRQLRDIVDEITAARTVEERLRLPELDERRGDIIVGGSLLLHEVMVGLDLEAMTISEFALREGILLDGARRKAAGERTDFHHLSNIRRESVLRMADVFHEDLEHIQQATDLSLQIFDGLAQLHELSTIDRDYLEAAGLLHNVGLFVSHSAHHKHSYYVIRNSDQLVGFTDHEIELIALVSRYHRKSVPKASHNEYAALSPIDQRRVRLLAGILRVGIALDRTRNAAVQSVAVEVVGPKKNRQAILRVEAAGDANISLEQYTATERIGLLKEAMDQPVELAFACALDWENDDD